MATTTWLIPSSSSQLHSKGKTRNGKRCKSYCSSSSLVQFQSVKLSLSLSNSVGFAVLSSVKKTRGFTVSAVVDEEPVVAEEINGEENLDNNDGGSIQESSSPSRPCELYICNLPRSFDIPQLLEMFKPYGTVVSVEVCRNAETGVSRGSGYVTVGSINAAKSAIAALDGSDVGEREMRVRFSADMNRRRNPEVLNSAPRKNLIYESPYKIYVGNLSRAVRPEDLRSHFEQFGTIVSARVLHDRKSGKYRIYGFLSFTSATERDASISLNGTEFYGRTLVVREGFERSEPPEVLLPITS